MKKYILIVFLLITLNLYGDENIFPLPMDYAYDTNKALLGKELFHDTRLSKDNTVSCATCHILSDGGDDNMRFSFGVNARLGNINAPTVLNSRYNLSQFWDGRAKNLKEQAKGPIENPIEMASSMTQAYNTIKQIPKYTKRFNKLYPDGLTKDNILDAIAEFEKALVTPNSRFDQYLRGDKNALTQEENEGYKLFKENGCISCHNGVNIGSNLYQKVGIYKTYIDDTSNLGRYNVTKHEKDKYFFKVPTLRNIALTAPYLHNGKFKTLRAVVKFMFIYQVGLVPSSDELNKIEAFLKTLTGETPKIMKEKQ